MRYPKKLDQRADEILASRRREAIRRQEVDQVRISVAHPEIPEARSTLSRLHARYGVAKIRGRAEEMSEIETRIGVEQDRLQRLMADAGLTDADLQPRYECPVCEDRGYVDGRPCACRQAILNHLVYEQLCDVSPVQSCSFGGFDLHYYDDADRTTMAKVLESCKRYVRNFDAGGQNLLFCGPPGLGKTHLSLAIAERVARSGHLVMYASAPRLMGQLESAKFRQAEENLEYREVIYGCELLVIDDLGAEMVTRYTQSEMYDLINSRLNTSRPTIISTNLTIEEIDKLYTNRVASRIAGAYATVQFRGRDIRLQKRMERMVKS